MEGRGKRGDGRVWMGNESLGKVFSRVQISRREKVLVYSV